MVSLNPDFITPMGVLLSLIKLDAYIINLAGLDNLRWEKSKKVRVTIKRSVTGHNSNIQPPILKII